MASTMHPAPHRTQRPSRARPRRGSAADKLAPIAACVALLAGTLGSAQPEAERSHFKIIVHPSNPRVSIDRNFLAHAYLKKVANWPHGELIRPVDQQRDSPIRLRFTQTVLERSPVAVRNYWQQIIFSGRGVPPPEVESDAVVVAFVQRHPGALGYVAAGADLQGTKPITVVY
jgi:hypothetical protein